MLDLFRTHAIDADSDDLARATLRVARAFEDPRTPSSALSPLSRQLRESVLYLTSPFRSPRLSGHDENGGESR